MDVCYIHVGGPMIYTQTWLSGGYMVFNEEILGMACIVFNLDNVPDEDVRRMLKIYLSSEK